MNRTDNVTDPGKTVTLKMGALSLEGFLAVPPLATGLVVFVHGSGSSRHSRRNQYVARFLQERGLGTLLFDLLTPAEDDVDRLTRHLRFDIEMLARRVVAVTRWLRSQPETSDLNFGYFGSSTGAAAALVAAAYRDDVGAVVSRGGRPDLALDVLGDVTAPTLLIVGERDVPVIEMNRSAYVELEAPKKMELVPRASHLFEEPGTLEEVAELAAAWFEQHL